MDTTTTQPTSTEGSENSGVIADQAVNEQSGGDQSLLNQTNQLTKQFDAPEWKTKLNEEYREHPTIRNFKDLNEFAKSYIHAQSLVGADKLVVPKDGSGEDAWNDVWNKLGRPEDPSKYEFNVEGETDEALLNAFKEQAHGAGLNTKQAQKLVEWWNEFNSGQMEKIQSDFKQQQEQGVSQLKAEWGEKGFEKNLSNARVAIDKYTDDNFKSWLDQTGLGNDPNMIKLFSKIGEGMAEKPVRGDDPGLGMSMGVDAAQKRISSIKADLSHPYWDAKAPGHQDAVKEVQELYAVAYPDLEE